MNFNRQSFNDFQAIVALTFAQYAAKPFFPECEPPDVAVRILAALCLGKYSLHYLMEFDLNIRRFSLLLCSSSDSNQLHFNETIDEGSRHLHWCETLCIN